MSGHLKYLRQTFRNIRKTLQIATSKEIYVGSDEHGNKYYERPENVEKGIKNQRRVLPLSSDQFLVPTVPTEWMTWLQGRRESPPTPEEIEMGRIESLKIQYRVQKLESKQEEENVEEEASAVKPQNEKVSFPVYPEFEVIPGEHRNKKPKG